MLELWDEFGLFVGDGKINHLSSSYLGIKNLEPEDEIISGITASLNELLKIQPESLVRTDDLGKDLNFESGLPIFRKVLRLFNGLNNVDLSTTPLQNLNQIKSYTEQVLSYFKQIQEFSIQQNPSNPVGTRDQLIEQLRQSYTNYHSSISPVIAFAARSNTDFDSLEREARGALSLQTQLLNDTRFESSKMLAEMQDAFKKVRDAAAEAGVAQHAIHFREEGEIHRKQSRIWLIASFVFAVVTALVVALHRLLSCWRLHAQECFSDILPSETSARLSGMGRKANNVTTDREPLPPLSILFLSLVRNSIQSRLKRRFLK